MTTRAIQEPILVTGAAGFLGNAMVCRFQEQSKQVRAFILEGQQPDPRWREHVEVFEGDVTQPETLVSAMKAVGTVFHNVAKVGDWGAEELFYRVAVEGTQNLIDLALREDARFLSSRW